MRFDWVKIISAAGLLLHACSDVNSNKLPSRELSQVKSDLSAAPVARVHTVEEWLNLIDQRPSAVTYVDQRLLIDFRRKQAQIHTALMFSSPWRFAELSNRSCRV